MVSTLKCRCFARLRTQEICAHKNYTKMLEQLMSHFLGKMRFHPFSKVRKYHPILTITHVSKERKTTLLLISPKNPSPPTFGIYEILVKIHGRILPIGSMGLVYIYLHENHKKSSIHVGKYTIVPWILWVLYSLSEKLI